MTRPRAYSMIILICNITIQCSSAPSGRRESYYGFFKKSYYCIYAIRSRDALLFYFICHIYVENEVPNPTNTPINCKEKNPAHLCTHITSKQIELEGRGWSGLVRVLISNKT